MTDTEKTSPAVDWNLATWDGARREALRRWAQLPLERIIAALEEMQELSDMLAKSTAKRDKLVGCLRYDGVAKTQEDMVNAIRMGANPARDATDD